MSKRISELIQRDPDGTEYIEVIIPPFTPGTNRKVLLSDILALVGGGAVDSVNGQTGVVVLDATDVGADPAGSASTVASNLSAHIADATDAHAGTAIGNTPAGGISSTTVQAAINELDSEKASTGSVSTVSSDLAAHIADSTAAHAASAISFSPTGTIAATDVQAAIAEVNTEAVHITGTETVTGAKTFTATLQQGATTITGGVALMNPSTTGTVRFYSYNGSISGNTDIGLDPSLNFLFTTIKWQTPGFVFTSSGSTSDSNASTLLGSGGQTTSTNRLGSSGGNGLTVTLSSSGSISANQAYTQLLVTGGNRPFNPSSGTTTSQNGVVVQNSINASGGTSTVTGYRYFSVETSMTGVDHYGFISDSQTAKNGFGTLTPNSIVGIGGSLSTAYVAKTGAYTLGLLDHTVEVTSGTHTQTLPTAVGITGREYYITNTGSGVVTVGTTSSQTFVNVSGTPTTLTLNQFETAHVKSNGANWLKL